MAELKIENLYAEVEGKQILNGINLTIKNGEVVALLGPNGHGKSTLFNVIMGHPKYKVTKGSVKYNGKDILSLTTDERAKLGLFLAFQNPSEVPGVSNSDFLRAAVNTRLEKNINTYQFYKMLNNAANEASMPFEYATRNLNEGFSGGEKKRNEMLQMLLLKPQLAMLDEIDSGLDVDAIQVVSNIINKEKSNDRSFLVISHYARLFDLIKPTRAVVIINGKIAVDGDSSLIKRIDKEGYEFIKLEYGIEIKKQEVMNTVSIGTCAVKEIIK